MANLSDFPNTALGSDLKAANPGWDNLASTSKHCPLRCVTWYSNAHIRPPAYYVRESEWTHPVDLSAQDTASGSVGSNLAEELNRRRPTRYLTALHGKPN